MKLLETDRCLLREICEADRQHVVRLHSDPEVRRFLGGPRVEALSHERFDLQLTSRSPYWIVTKKADQAFVGEISLDPHHDGEAIEISFVFSSLHWGKGYASETLPRVIAYAFKELNCLQLVSETQIGNQPSCRLLQRLGFRVDRRVERFGQHQAVYVKMRT
jgi:ribosomal-protein-alanine N-acetyltransferase